MTISDKKAYISDVIKPPSLQKKKFRFFWDLEVLPYVFTNAFVDMENKIIVVMVKDKTDTPVYDLEVVHQYLQKAWSDYTLRPIMNMDDVKTFHNFTQHFMNQVGDTEWFGWNTKGYDLMLMAGIIAHFEKSYTLPETETIREWSDFIIVDGLRYAGSFFGRLGEVYGDAFRKRAGYIYRSCLASLKHVDTGALNEQSGESDIEKVDFMFPLKVMQSYTGNDVVEDDMVKGDGSITPEMVEKGIMTKDGQITTKGLIRLLYYNINDVVSNGIIFEEKEYKGKLKTLDTLRTEYPFVTKGTGDKGYLYQITRDATSTQFAGKIIIGEDEIKPVDLEAVSYDFPFPDGTKNALDFIEQNETGINPRVIEFYRHVEGQDTRTKDDYNRVKDTTLTGKTTINVPYMNSNGDATSGFITLSWGGAHGGVVKNAHGRRLDRKEDEKWFREFETIKMKNVVATVDVKNVIHVDFKSYYPTLNILLGVYKTGDVDNYYLARESRYELKDMLTEELFETDRAMYDDIDEKQDSRKLVLNGATGGSNQHKERDKVDLPLDNATLSMRILGNLFIYVLGQRFTNAGGLVISTNTDGLYVYGVSMEDAERVVDDFYKTYGLELDPEHVDRMINKSANERMEIYSNKTVIGGDLKRSLGDRIDLRSKINYPRVSGKAVIEYMQSRDTWLMEPIDVKYLKTLVSRQLEDSNPIDWTVTLKGNRDRTFYLEDTDDYASSNLTYQIFDTQLKKIQSTNRIVMTTKGQRIIQHTKGKEEKISGLTSNVVTILNKKRELDDFDSYKDNLDIDAYTQWAYNLLNKWHNPAIIPEIDGKSVEITEQISWDDLYS